MMTVISILHLLVALLLIFLVLIQDSKGGAMGGMLGGGGGGGGNANSLLGATGATSFLVKLTRVVAVVFAASCITLTIMSTNQTKSVVDGFVPPVTDAPLETAPAADSPETTKEGDTSSENQ